jgi:DNA-binding CsgD family transcriptional regulator
MGRSTYLCDSGRSPTMSPLPEILARLLDALARPIVVADANKTILYRSPTFRDCMARSSVQERAELQAEIDSALSRLCSRAQAHPDQQSHVLTREVLTLRSEFRLRGIILPAGALHNSAGVLIELERMGKRAVHTEELHRCYGLTARQCEVARLLARGYSDEAIAARLGISTRTAEHHTEQVLRKLGADRRSAVAAMLLSGK